MHILPTFSHCVLPWNRTRSSSVCAADKDTPVKTTTIVGRLENLDKTPFNMTTHITLNHQQFTTYSRADGGFAIYNVPPGVHQLDIHNNNYHFGQVKIQLLENEMDAPKCLEYAYPGALKQVIAYPLVLRPHATYTYFEKRQGLSLFSILKNPMVIMMVISLGLMFLMPKMMEGLGKLGVSLFLLE